MALSCRCEFPKPSQKTRSYRLKYEKCSIVTVYEQEKLLHIIIWFDL